MKPAAFTLEPESPAAAAAAEQATASAPNPVQAQVERHGLEWLAPLFPQGNGGRLIRPKGAAGVMQCSDRHVYSLIEGKQLEAVKVGSDYRVTKRSLMIHLWEGWSGRHTATASQITAFVVLLLAHLPIKALTAIRDACAHLIARRAEAEHALGLSQRQHSRKPGKHTPVQQGFPIFSANDNDNTNGTDQAPAAPDSANTTG